MILSVGLWVRSTHWQSLKKKGLAANLTYVIIWHLETLLTSSSFSIHSDLDMKSPSLPTPHGPANACVLKAWSSTGCILYEGDQTGANLFHSWLNPLISSCWTGILRDEPWLGLRSRSLGCTSILSHSFSASCPPFHCGTLSHNRPRDREPSNSEL